jgi:hypothetical protein
MSWIDPLQHAWLSLELPISRHASCWLESPFPSIKKFDIYQQFDPMSMKIDKNRPKCYTLESILKLRRSMTHQKTSFDATAGIPVGLCARQTRPKRTSKKAPREALA